MRVKNEQDLGQALILAKVEGKWKTQDQYKKEEQTKTKDTRKKTGLAGIRVKNRQGGVMKDKG